MISFLGLVLAFLFREVFTWYWKINEIVDTLKRIEQRLPPPPEEEKKAKENQQVEKEKLFTDELYK